MPVVGIQRFEVAAADLWTEFASSDRSPTPASQTTAESFPCGLAWTSGKTLFYNLTVAAFTADQSVQLYRNEIPFRPGGEITKDFHTNWAGDFAAPREQLLLHSLAVSKHGDGRAQALQQDEIATMRKDPVIRKRIVKSFAMMLDFYGFRLDEVNHIVRTNGFQERFANLKGNDRNHRRIMRILKFLGHVGLKRYQKAWLTALKREVHDTKNLKECRASYEGQWVHATACITLRTLPLCVPRVLAIQRTFHGWWYCSASCRFGVVWHRLRDDLSSLLRYVTVLHGHRPRRRRHVSRVPRWHVTIACCRPGRQLPAPARRVSLATS
jgi:hypothetical protein